MAERPVRAAGRRTVLKLLAGSVAGASGLSASLAVEAEPSVRVADIAIALEFDSVLRSRVLARRDNAFEPITDYDASETLLLTGGDRVNEFRFQDARQDRIEDAHGAGARHVLRGIGESLEKELSVVLYDRFPGLALFNVTYRNVGEKPVAIEKWLNGAHVLKPASESEPEYWSFSGATYEDRRDWVQPVRAGFGQRNFLGMNSSDYGGGTPVVDVWRRDCGLAVGHLETVPKLVALPLAMTEGGGPRVAVECDQTIVLAPGGRFSTYNTFVAVHHGDHFTILDAYRRILGERGIAQARVPAAAYAPIWCAWGYERDFTVAQIIRTLPKARELGLVWAGVDDGWQTAEGDWYLDPKKFPRGDPDMIALVEAIKREEMKPKLWIAPLAARPGTDLLRDHSDMLLLDKDGAVQNVTWWDSYTLCPAYPKTVEWGKTLVRRMMGQWGYEGLKLDGQHLNGVAPCYNPAHGHARPEESVEKLQEFWAAIYKEAISINPDAVIELCPCGTCQAFHNLPYMNQPVASDPLTSWQVRHKGKTIKALMGRSAAYAGDHVELSDRGDDFASTVGIGAIVSTKFTWPEESSEAGLLLTKEKEAVWRRWIALHNEMSLPQGHYRGDLYDIGFDKPEAHVVAKGERLYYAFYAERWNGAIELRGLENRQYTVMDYWTGRTFGAVSPGANRLSVSFERFLLLEAMPVNRA
jgi:alpha-galactosidase